MSVDFGTPASPGSELQMQSKRQLQMQSLLLRTLRSHPCIGA